MELVHELPFLPKQHLLAASDPTATQTSDAPLRTLKRHDVVSGGLDLKLRSREAGRLVGSVHVYCSLNRDAIRLARMGKWDIAARLATEALRIEQSPDARRLKAALEATPVPVRTDEPWQTYVHAIQAGSVRSVAMKVAKSVARVRAKVGALEHARRSLTGIIVGLDGSVAEVESASGEHLRVHRGALSEIGWDRIGAAVAIHVEEHKQFLLWEIEPALSSTGEVAIDPFDYEWPASNTLTARIEDLLSSNQGTIPLPTADAAAV